MLTVRQYFEVSVLDLVCATMKPRFSPTCLQDSFLPSVKDHERADAIGALTGRQYLRQVRREAAEIRAEKDLQPMISEIVIEGYVPQVCLFAPDTLTTKPVCKVVCLRPVCFLHLHQRRRQCAGSFAKVCLCALFTSTTKAVCRIVCLRPVCVPAVHYQRSNAGRKHA